MPLPSSGQLSIGDIRQEITGTRVGTNTSLQALYNIANLPPKSSNIAISDFYGYRHPTVTWNGTIDKVDLAPNWQLTFTLQRDFAATDLAVNINETAEGFQTLSNNFTATFTGTNTTTSFTRFYTIPTSGTTLVTMTIDQGTPVNGFFPYKGEGGSVFDILEPVGTTPPPFSSRIITFSAIRGVDPTVNQLNGWDSACDAVNQVSPAGSVTIYIAGSGFSSTTPPPVNTQLYTNNGLTQQLNTTALNKFYSVTGGDGTLAWKINNGVFVGQSQCSGGIF